MPSIHPIPSRISDDNFSDVLTLRDAYRVMEIFVQRYLERGDTQVSDFIYSYAGLLSDGRTTDPASLEDFLAAWHEAKAMNKQPEESSK